MFDVAEMNSDLVRSAGFEPAFYNRNVPKSFSNFVMCNCSLSQVALGNYLYYLPVADIPSHISCYGTFRRVRSAPHKRNIFSVGCFVVELFGKPVKGKLIFCDDQDTRSVFVNPVYKSGTQFPCLK